ncbi:hypothetical protein SERLA73DRAFT_160769 [Serpula lacrymans var. lacrymans S7.3]|uniref:Uncharacterized protein n=2 Tax=Serpula lacrymans var. lacrymans TaxID=341189 RepID=F8PX70_SERL3|nr:uncharacterized protein SERLADRAFT_415829 [Serpula lacrymans var. lacrymans S7.9]EGN99345.1 hypothetical protein SERLA73DRAFT_160769 [Serpula lacrymans var. lacrymans S7.3]EGO24909.1 hypothetical protein SERLADRAFT_415829 [Serpula lacrymans var. lacrymans S7.9]
MPPTLQGSADLSLLRAEVRHEEENVRSLRLQLAAAEQRLTLKRSRLKEHDQPDRASYISLLPDELLSAIFNEVLKPALSEPATTRVFFERVSSKPRFALVLSHVSKLWRSIAIATASLWATDIRLYPDQSVQLLETYITRAKQHLLDIYIVDTSARAAVSPVESRRIAVLLADCIARCRRLSIMSQWDLACPLLFQLVNASAPSLCELCLAIKGGPPVTHDKLALFTNGGAPVLSSLEVRNVPPSTFGHFFQNNTLTSLILSSTSLNDILHVHETRFSARDFLNLLGASPALGSLVLYGDPVRFDAADARALFETVKLPVLHTLVLMPVRTCSYLYNVLKLLDIPSLHSLTLDLRRIYSYNVMNTLVDFLRYDAQYVNLRNFTLYGGLNKDDVAFAAVRAFPNVVSLTVSVYTNTMLKVLTRGDTRREEEEERAVGVDSEDEGHGAESFWPGLKEIVIEDTAKNVNLHRLLKMLQFRKKMGRPLEGIKFDDLDGRFPWFNAPFNRLLQTCVAAELG